MATEQEFKAYCIRHGLSCIGVELMDQLFGADEWVEALRTGASRSGATSPRTWWTT